VIITSCIHSFHTCKSKAIQISVKEKWSGLSINISKRLARTGSSSYLGKRVYRFQVLAPLALKQDLEKDSKQTFLNRNPEKKVTLSTKEALGFDKFTRDFRKIVNIRIESKIYIILSH